MPRASSPLPCRPDSRLLPSPHAISRVSRQSASPPASGSSRPTFMHIPSSTLIGCPFSRSCRGDHPFSLWEAGETLPTRRIASIKPARSPDVKVAIDQHNSCIIAYFDHDGEAPFMHRASRIGKKPANVPWMMGKRSGYIKRPLSYISDRLDGFLPLI